MLPKSVFEKRLNIKIATSNLMDNAISLWLDMYENKPPWLGGKANVKSLNLPAAISEEMARLVLTEFEFTLNGSARADFLQGSLDNFFGTISNTMELWCALGGIAIKPYASGSGEVPDEICMDVVTANRFYPTAFNSNQEITAAVFIETKRVGDYLFTRLEHHALEGEHYTVTNKAFRSERLNTTATEDDMALNVSHPFLEEVTLDAVDEWAGLAPIVEMDGIEHPFFVYVKIPRANNIDPHSPLGASVYARAVDVIKEADRQFARILWEYKATEAAIDADASLFQTDNKGNPILPEGEERLYRSYDFEGKDANAGFLKEFSPAIRDESLFHGLNEFMRKIEFLCGLAYGTLSDPNDVAHTATEIKLSKQRSYTAVSAMQKAWSNAFDRLIYIMDALCTLYQIVPPGEINKTCTWGDSVLEDTEVEYQRRWSMVLAGKMKLEKFYSWYFGCTEEEAKDYIPESPTYPPIE